MTVDLAGLDVGTELPPLRVILTRAHLVRYAGASGDFNPIHYSDRLAAQAALPGVVAHGLLTLGCALRAVTDWVGDPARVRSSFARFTRPVVVPDDDQGTVLEVTATVVAVAERRATVALDVVCQGQKVLGAARAEVEW